MSAAGAGGPARRPLSRGAIDLVAIGVLTAVGVAGFAAVFVGPDFAIAGGVGLLVGLGVAVLGARFRLGLLPVAAAVILAYFLFGAVAVFRQESIAGVVPTLSVLRSLLFGSVTAWKSLLTIQPPIDGFADLLIVPYLGALVVSVTAASIALRSKRYAFALLPPAVLLGASIAFGAATPTAPVALAAVFAGCSVGWVAWRRHIPGDSRASTGRRRASATAVTSIALALGLVLVAVVAGGVGASALAPDTHRDSLRDTVTPPLDLHDYASPLSSFRKYVGDDKDTVLFSVAGLAPGQRVRLATMDTYDGLVYNVSGSGGAGSGTFTRVGDTIAPTVTGTAQTLTFTVGALNSVWVPDSGYLTAVSFSGPRASVLQNALNYNDATGVAVDTAALQTGDQYSVSTIVPPTVSDDQLAGQAATKLVLPKPQAVPEALAAAATAAIGDASSPIAQLRALEASLSHDGFFSHGLQGEAASRPGHGSERLESLLTSDQMIGDDEQYATVMALMADQLGLPARVVMGFYPPKDAATTGTVDIHGSDVHAWVEVAINGAGWVSFDPTPPKDQIPQNQAPKPKAQPKAQVQQPPAPPVEPAEVPADSSQEDSTTNDSHDGFGWIGTAATISGISLAVLLIILGPAIAIAIVKGRRRTRRRTAGRDVDKISGGWTEVVDYAADLGTVLPRGSTRREDARSIAEAHPAAELPLLATRADTAVFGPGEPTEAETAAYWSDVERALAELSGSVGWFGRLKARISLRSLRSGSGSGFGSRSASAPDKGRGVTPSTGGGTAPTDGRGATPTEGGRDD